MGLTYNFEASIAVVFALAQMKFFVDDTIRCIVYNKENWNRYNQINADDYVCGAHIFIKISCTVSVFLVSQIAITLLFKLITTESRI